MLGKKVTGADGVSPNRPGAGPFVYFDSTVARYYNEVATVVLIGGLMRFHVAY